MSTKFDVKEELKRRMAAAKEANGAPSEQVVAMVEAVAPVEEPIAPKAPLVIGEGQKSASDILGVELESDFAVDVLKNEDIPEQVRMFIPTVNPAYHVQKEAAVILLRALQDGDKVLVTGPTGSGKSSLLAHLCALTNRPMVRLNMSGDVESSVIFGMLTVSGGATVWKDGAATEAVRYGAVLVNDEWDVTPPEIMFGYQWLMEDKGKLYLKEMPGDASEKMIAPHPNFRFVCLGNTLGQGDSTGKFAGTNVQNSATLDRFQTTVHLSYLDKAHEVQILLNAVPKIGKKVADKIVSVAQLIRQGYEQGQLALTMSPRTIINFATKAHAWGDVHQAFLIAYGNKLDEHERGAAVAILKKVFG